MKLALIFDKQREGTSGIYFERACQALDVAYDHWWLRDVDRIPATYDLYLRIDHGDGYTVKLPSRLRPAAFYAIDTHLPRSWRKIHHLVGGFNLVFCAQSEAARRVGNGIWVPFGFDPEFHTATETETEPVWDIGFVGTSGGVPRKFYLQALMERYPKSFIGAADPTRLAAIYSRCRIGFNYSIGNDINMRMFEVLAARTLLITNALRGNDLQRLGLEDRRHLAVYRSPAELFNLIDYLLAHSEERAQIARAGYDEVRARHTYAHRLRQMLDTVSQRLGLPVFVPAPNPALPSGAQ